MSLGLIALFDDVAALAKVAAASLDDVAGQAAKAGSKAAGVVIDDAAVTPRYVTGFSPDRELPIIWKITLGSLRNKLFILLPAALALSYFAPAVIIPLLMLGGLYLSYEGVEKLYELVFPHAAHAHEATVQSIAPDAQTLEDQKVAGAIRTDFILSAEIMTISLGAVPDAGLWAQAGILLVVGILITVAVYGVVAAIVKADDLGLMLASTSLGSPAGAPIRAVGRGLVLGTPHFMTALGLIGTAAMVWVGGGIILHGLESYSLDALSRLLHDAGAAAAHAMPAIGAFASWLVQAAGAGLVGIVVGGFAIPAVSYGVAPVWRLFKTR